MRLYSTIIPWRGGCEYRERSLRYITKRYQATWPHLSLRVTTYEGEPWCKAIPIVGGLRKAKAGPVVIADSDVWCDGLPLAIEAVGQGAPWAIPHKMVHRLSQEGTDRYIAGEPLEGLPLAERLMIGMSGGGIVVADRDTLLKIPPDPRFIGWGSEDEAWAMALKKLAGKPWRGTAPMAHCWHPTQPRMSRRWGSPEARTLRQKYQRAQESRESMQALIEEAFESFDTCKPSLHDHQAGGERHNGRLRKRGANRVAG